jgi:hypothetical protein
MNNKDITPERLDQLWKDSSNWTGGLFYHSKEDPRVIVPKRQKWRGWTMNFARVSAIPVLILMILFLVAPLYYLKVHGYANTWIWWTTIAVVILATCVGCAYAASSRRYRN